MKSQLDDLMAERGLDAIFVAGEEGQNNIRDYMTNGAQLHSGYVIKKRGAEPLLIVNAMEIGEGRKSGYPCKTFKDFDVYHSMYLGAEDRIALWGRCLREAGVESGKVGIYGTGEINEYGLLVPLANERLDGYEFVGEIGLTLFDSAFLTKDEREVERITSVAERTNIVVEAAWNFIAGHRADSDEVVIQEDGSPLTIGDVKTFIRMELMKHGLKDTGMIFAQGRDSGFPHSHGEDNDALRLGQTIIFDIFPQELNGGYHHDMTRTWCIGYAPPEVQQLYDEVMEAFDISIETFGVGKLTASMQDAVQDYFESKGHKTARSHPSTQEGYVHGLGHGIGLFVHERPSISHLIREDIWQIGNVVTIEPGLYYPDKGYGVRIEDLFIVTESGELVSLTPFRKDLVLPLRN